MPAGLDDVGQLFWHVPEAVRLKNCRLSNMRHEGCQLISARCQLMCLAAVGLADHVSVIKVQQSKVLQPGPACLLRFLHAPANGVGLMQSGIACKKKQRMICMTTPSAPPCSVWWQNVHLSTLLFCSV